MPSGGDRLHRPPPLETGIERSSTNHAMHSRSIVRQSRGDANSEDQENMRTECAKDGKQFKQCVRSCAEIFSDQSSL